MKKAPSSLLSAAKPRTIHPTPAKTCRKLILKVFAKMKKQGEPKLALLFNKLTVWVEILTFVAITVYVERTIYIYEICQIPTADTFLKFFMDSVYCSFNIELRVDRTGGIVNLYMPTNPHGRDFSFAKIVMTVDAAGFACCPIIFICHEVMQVRIFPVIFMGIAVAAVFIGLAGGRHSVMRCSISIGAY